MSEPIRVVVADDQTLVRRGIRGLLELGEEVVVVGEAADGDEALALVDAERPDVLLLDLRMPGRDGISTLEVLGETDHAPPVLVLTTFDDDALALRALRAGARGFLLKDVTLDSLLSAIRTLHAGGTALQPALTERLLRGPVRRDDALDPLPEPLTPREADVLRLMAAGYSNAEIASALHLATGTVKNRVSDVLVKLGTRDRTRAVLRALDLGLLGQDRASGS